MSRWRMLKVITRFNLPEFAEGVSDLGALRLLLERGAQVRGVRNLHAKLYVFDNDRAIVTSANLTAKALRTNHELGCVVETPGIVARCARYFDRLWARGGRDLDTGRL